ncbi:hypothetical protein IAT38_002250 [Cryptococcus sp. DSM 104549]
MSPSRPFLLLALASLALLHPTLADYTDQAADSAEDSCAAGAAGDYDTGLHIASVFVMLFASGLGVFLPVLLGGRGARSMWFGGAFFALKYFGTGIIISLAFCHLLQDSFETFSNECIGELLYEPTAPAIAMASMTIIWLIDFFGSRWITKHTPASDTGCDPIPTSRTPGTTTPPSPDIKSPFVDLCCDSGCKPVEVFDGSAQRAHWDVQLLEGGIVFHSVMIGVSLGAQTDGFEVTFAALVFHQLFEGLGLGARIGMLLWRAGIASSIKKWSMCMAYTVVTPVGIAIGMGVHQSFNENGRAGLLAIGVLNSISAGILLYSGLCQLLFAEWVVGDMREASTRKVAVALVALLLGMFAMSLIGKWT